MTRFVLIIGAGLLAAKVAYAAPDYCKTNAPNRCTDIKNLVCNLQLPYAPNGKGPGKCASIDGRGRDAERARRRLATNADIIQSAFTIAPAGLKQCLCSLKHIYVTADPQYNNWGKWEGRGSGNSSIALYTSTLNANTTVPTLMNQQLTLLGVANSVGHYTDNSNSSNALTLAVLYALAHEMGHMAFRRDYNSLNGCTLQTFLTTSWKDAASWQDWATKRPWTYFADTNFGTLVDSIPPPTNANAADLAKIFTSTVVTSLAAANPEEDFVEAYSIEALNLATANSYNLSMVIGAQSYPVNQGRSSLTPKFQCVDSILQ